MQILSAECLIIFLNLVGIIKLDRDGFHGNQMENQYLCSAKGIQSSDCVENPI